MHVHCCIIHCSIRREISFMSRIWQMDGCGVPPQWNATCQMKGMVHYVTELHKHTMSTDFMTPLTWNTWAKETYSDKRHTACWGWGTATKRGSAEMMKMMSNDSVAMVTKLYQYTETINCTLKWEVLWDVDYVSKKKKNIFKREERSVVWWWPKPWIAALGRQRPPKCVFEASLVYTMISFRKKNKGCRGQTITIILSPFKT